MIKLENVYFKYKTNKKDEFILNNLNLHINKSEFVSIIGSNGVGKTSLVKLISGLTVPSKGEIFINDFNTKSKKDFMNIRNNISVVFQNPDNQIIFERVYEELEFTLKRQNLSREEIEKRIDTSLKQVNMEDYKFSLTSTLSMGQKQKIIIAEALSLETDYIVLDEPTAMLDPDSKKQILNLLCELNKSGKTIILITHILDEIFYSDRCIYLKDNKIKHDFYINSLLEKDEIKTNKSLEILKDINSSNSNFILNLLTKIIENNIKVNIDKNNFHESLIDELINIKQQNKQG